MYQKEKSRCTEDGAKILKFNKTFFFHNDDFFDSNQKFSFFNSNSNDQHIYSDIYFVHKISIRQLIQSILRLFLHTSKPVPCGVGHPTNIFAPNSSY